MNQAEQYENLSVDQFFNKIEIQNQKTIKKVRKKNLIIFIGNTGVGKTSLIKLLSGYSIIAKGDQENGFEFQTEVSSVKSDTKEIQIIEKGQFAYCDCPGFNDSRGYQQDILNCLSIKQAIQHSGKKKIVVVLSQSEVVEPKYTKIMALFKKLSLIFPALSEQNFTICVNRCYFLTQIMVKNHLNKLVQCYQEITQSQKVFYDFLSNKCKINIVKVPNKVGEYKICKVFQKNVTTFSLLSDLHFEEKYFKLISDSSKLDVHKFIMKVNEKIKSINIQKGQQQETLKILNIMETDLLVDKISIKQVIEGTSAVNLGLSGIAMTIGGSYTIVGGTLVALAQGIFAAEAAGALLTTSTVAIGTTATVGTAATVAAEASLLATAGPILGAIALPVGIIAFGAITLNFGIQMLKQYSKKKEQIKAAKQEAMQRINSFRRLFLSSLKAKQIALNTYQQKILPKLKNLIQD